MQFKLNRNRCGKDNVSYEQKKGVECIRSFQDSKRPFFLVQIEKKASGNRKNQNGCSQCSETVRCTSSFRRIKKSKLHCGEIYPKMSFYNRSSFLERLADR